jgi:hypothetical protein
MNHVAIIQSEFMKEARKWKDLSYEDQKSYLKRHPASKRKITAKPEGSRQEKDEGKKEKSVKEDSTSSSSLLDKIKGKSHSELKDEITKLQTKIDARNAAAVRREQRAHGDLDGTAIEAAYDRNRPLEIKISLIKHYLEHGDKPLPEELQKEVEDIQGDIAYKSEYKEKQQKEKEKYADLVGKMITWKSKKNFGKEMSARVVSVKAGRQGIKVKTDTGWRVPVSLITKSTEPPKGEKNKELVTAKDLIGKTVSWKTKYRPGFRAVRGFPGARMERSAPPGYDSAKGTASGKVESTKGSKVVVGSWRIPLPLILDVNGKKFEKWK